MGTDPIDAIIRSRVALEEAASCGEERLVGMKEAEPLLSITASLRVVADLADSLADYFGTFSVLSEAITTPPLDALRACLPTHPTITRIVHAAYVPAHHYRDESQGWLGERELFIGFTYYRASYTASSSAFAVLGAFASWAAEQAEGPELAELWADLRKYLGDPSLGAGMRRLASRARALAETPGREEKETEILWWLERPDEYPPRHGLTMRVERYLSSCPDTSDARIRERLRVISADPAMPEEIRARALAMIGEGGRDTL